jgi:ribokinase
MKKHGILVVGSANADLVVRTRRFPAPGETILEGTFATFPGGKGANQAVACAKAGGFVTFLGRMGRDAFGDRLTAGMCKDGVCMDHVQRDPKLPTGIALITVDAGGQNEIIVASGSNMALSPDVVTRHRPLFATAQVVLLQLEIPPETVMQAARLGHEHGAIVILNPAPARHLPRTLLRLADFVTPNETELAQLAGMPVLDNTSAIEAARRLLEIGVRNVIVTLGRKGCLLVNEDTCRTFPARRVRAVDTTAAGDAFNGALAAALARGEELRMAIPFANDVASFSVTRMGAQSSMPTLRELAGFRRTFPRPMVGQRIYTTRAKVDR